MALRWLWVALAFKVQGSRFKVRCWMLNVGCSMLGARRFPPSAFSSRWLWAVPAGELEDAAEADAETVPAGGDWGVNALGSKHGERSFGAGSREAGGHYPLVILDQAPPPGVRRRRRTAAWRTCDGVAGLRRMAGAGRGWHRIQQSAIAIAPPTTSRNKSGDAR